MMLLNCSHRHQILYYYNCIMINYDGIYMHNYTIKPFGFTHSMHVCTQGEHCKRERDPTGSVDTGRSAPRDYLCQRAHRQRNHLYCACAAHDCGARAVAGGFKHRTVYVLLSS